MSVTLPRAVPYRTHLISTRRPVVPTKGLLDRYEGWALYRHPSTPRDSRLWPTLKVIHTAAIAGPKRRGVARVHWLYWGVDAGRFRHSRAERLFRTQAPQVYERFERACRSYFTAARAEDEIGGAAPLAAERARLAGSGTKRGAHAAARMERAHAVALEEDARRSSLPKFEDLL
jgi:hypothetical protein